MLDVSETANENDRNYGNSQFRITGPLVSYSLKEFETNKDRQKNTLRLKERNKFLFTISINVDQDF
jgi:hypothetical protein